YEVGLGLQSESRAPLARGPETQGRGAQLHRTAEVEGASGSADADEVAIVGELHPRLDLARADVTDVGVVDRERTTRGANVCDGHTQQAEKRAACAQKPCRHHDRPPTNDVGARRTPS